MQAPTLRSLPPELPLVGAQTMQIRNLSSQRSSGGGQSGPVDRSMHAVASPPTMTEPIDRVEVGSVAGCRGGVAEVQRKVDREQHLPLQPGAQSRLHVHDSPPPNGSVIMLHGFSAGTWQYDELSAVLHERGYNVYVPRTVGHGFAAPDGEQDSTQLPSASESHRYDRFASEALSDLEKLGGPLHVVGFSGGGAIATRILEATDDVHRAVIIAPFYEPKSELARNVIWGGGLADPWSFGAAGMVLDRLDYDFGVDTHRALPEWVRPGHRHVKLGNIYSLGQFGLRTKADAKNITTPVQFITTESDWAVHNDAVDEVLASAGGAGKHHRYHFPQSEAVPHTMFHPVENTDPDSYVRSRDMIIEYLTTGRGTHRPRR